MKVNVLSKQQGGTGRSPRGAHAPEGPQSHAAMPMPLTVPKAMLLCPESTGFGCGAQTGPPSIHPSTDPTPQPTHPGSGLP